MEGGRSTYGSEAGKVTSTFVKPSSLRRVSLAVWCATIAARSGGLRQASRHSFSASTRPPSPVPTFLTEG